VIGLADRRRRQVDCRRSRYRTIQTSDRVLVPLATARGSVSNALSRFAWQT